MAATGKTPILLYGSTTATNVPVSGNLTNSSDGCEIAINVADKNLFFKDSTNTVNTVPIRQSSTSSDGWLSSTDWNTFNNKQPAGTYVTSVTGTAPVVSSGGTTPAISMAAANGSTNGYLTSTDWSTFNNKVSSQWTTSGSNIYYLTGGVGLGTASPNFRLQLHTSTASAAQYMQVTNGSTGSTAGDGLLVGIDSANEAIVWMQEAANIKIATGGVEKLRVGSNDNVTVWTGNLVIGTSGKGIDFSATSGTGTSELLADYEEGTWTTTISASSNWNATPTLSAALYTKIGRLVMIEGKITGVPTTTGATTLTFSIPFSTAANSSGATGVAFEQNSYISGNVFDPTSGSATTMMLVTGPLTGGVTRVVNFSVTYCAA